MTVTPGPWVAVQADIDNEDPTRWAVCADGPERQFFVATIENGAPGDSLETEAANARLIAAAPDLLEACKTFLRYYDSHLAESRIGDEPGIAEMRAAVARAEGGAA